MSGKSAHVEPEKWPTRHQTPGSVTLLPTATGAQLFAEDGLSQASVSLSRDRLLALAQEAIEILRRPR